MTLAIEFGAALPDPGDPTFPAITAVLGGSLSIARVRAAAATEAP